MKHLHKKLSRGIAALLALALFVGLLPMQAFAYYAERPESLTFTDVDGKTVSVDESWEERFPYGTFAFATAQVTAEEGGTQQVLTVYRLGGTAGRASAYLTYQPALAEVTEGTPSYSNAAGIKDAIIEVENALPIAQYQPVGKEPDPDVPSPATQVVVNTDTEGYVLRADVEADQYQWQIGSEGEWRNIEDGTTQELPMDTELYEQYDYRCVYTVAEVRYCTNSAKGEVYVKPEEEVLPEMPETIDRNPEPSYTTLSNEGEEFDSRLFEMVFAEGEWKKDILITAVDDDLSEADEFGVFTIVSCEGGSLYDSANTATLHIVDNEAPEPSEIGFELSALSIDKAEGVARLTVRRTGGKQQVLTVDYETVDGTAKAGIDYAAASGKLQFYGDVDLQTIEVPLIDDGLPNSTPLNFTVRLSNLLGDNKGVASLNIAEATVFLTNSGTGDGDNLATVLKEQQATDVSAQIGESEAVTKAPEVVGGIEQPTGGEELVGKYRPNRARTFDYGTVPFSRNEISNYDTNYWKDYAVVAGNGGGEYSKVGGYTESNWSGAGTRWGTGGWQISSTGEEKATLTISDMSTKFSGLSGYLRWKPERCSEWTETWYGLEYIYPKFSCYSSSTGYNKSWDAGVTASRKNIFYRYSLSWYVSGSPSASWSMSDKVDTFALELLQYDAHDAEDPAYIELQELNLRRRTFENDLKLRIYTANDQDSVAGGGPVLNTSSDVYEKMRPEVSIVTKEGGVNSSGRLYVGSKLKVSLKNTDSYTPATNGSDLTYSVYLTDKNGNIEKANVEKASEGNVYFITLQWSNMTEADLKDQYVINVVMERSQTLELDFAPSVPRVVSGGEVTGNIDPTKIPAAKNDFWNSIKDGNITYGYHSSVSSSASTNRFEYHDNGTLNKNQLKASDDGSAVLKAKLLNLQWICFNLPKEDLILFNGKAYPGDEKIYLSMSDLAKGVLTFRYYDKEFLSAESIMTTSIINTAVYLDGNGNGKIDGSYNPNTGYFTPSDGDSFVRYLEEGERLEESAFAPIKNEEGQYCQFFLKVEYSMTPRSLNVPEGASASDCAQVLPAFITNITDPDERAKLTEEQQDYRYIISGKVMEDGIEHYSSDGHLMYGAEASASSFVDIPLGGDYSPPELTDKDTATYSWTPDYHGNLLYQFEKPEAIFIPKSYAGDNFPIAEIKGLGADGEVEFREPAAAVSKLNGYLGSFAGSSTFALCVREQEQTIDEILRNPGAMPVPESSNQSTIGSYPSSVGLNDMDLGSVGNDAGMDMNDSSNQYGEFNVDMGVELPSFPLGIPSYAAVLMDGYEVGFTIGLPVKYRNNISTTPDGDSGHQVQGWDNPFSLVNDKYSSFNAFTNFKNFLKNRDQASFDAMNINYVDGRDSGRVRSKNFGAAFNLNMAFLFKYNTVDNTYYFSEFAMIGSVSVNYKLQARLSVCPIVYMFINVGGGVELSTGLTAERVAVEGDEQLPDGKLLKKGDADQRSHVFKLGTHSFNLTFNGKVLIEFFSDQACTKPLADVNKYVTPGYMSSKGKKPVTITAFSKDDTNWVNSDGTLKKDVYVRLSAMEDSVQLSHLAPVTKNRTDVYWNGFQFTPSMFVEVGGGVGVDCLSMELFVKISISMTFTLGDYNVYTQKYSGYNTDEFDFGIGISLRVMLLLFPIEFNLAGYNVHYDGKTDTWTTGFKSDFKPNSRSRTNETEEAAGGEVRISLPGNNAGTQMVFSPESGGPQLRAIRPSGTDVPFQLSGYGSTGDAYRLVEGVSSGYTYQVVTVGDNQNYVVYMLSRENASAEDSSMLVLSKLKLTSANGKDSYGLVNPIDETDPTPYVLVDTDAMGADDGTGDLGFQAWSEGNIIRATWVSYAAKSTSESIVADERLENAANNTVIKSASFDTTGTTGFTAAETVSGTAAAQVFYPIGTDGKVVFYAETVPYSSAELESVNQNYANYLEKRYTTAETAATKDYLNQYQQAYHSLYGKGSTLNISVKGQDGARKITTLKLGADQIIENMSVSASGDGGYYLAYTTAESKYERDDRYTVRRLYLQKLTVAQDGTVTEGTAYLLRTLVDYDQDNTKDGLYVQSALNTAYQDPSFSNVKFLNGKLGNLVENTPEAFSALTTSDATENFLLFGMNGNTYVIPAASLSSITSSGSGSITPFFTPEDITDETGAVTGKEPTTGKAEVTIGADGAGNISAAYVTTVPNTTSNAVYVTKYDPESATWGEGTMLAMNQMQVYEDSVKNSWSGEETEQAYLGKLDGYTAEDAMTNVTFSNLQIALGQKKTASSADITQGSDGKVSNVDEALDQDAQPTDSSENAENEGTLLVLTEGAFQKLKEVQFQGDDGTVTSTVQPEGAASVGLYALSFGVGRQQIGNAYLQLGDYNFTAGSNLDLAVGFVNTGDVAIRGSTSNPVTVNLVVDTGTQTNILKSWKIEQSIAAGQKVELGGKTESLSGTLPTGSTFYLTVSEDATYVSAPFAGQTETLLTVEEKPELGFENIEITSVGVDSDGNTILNVDLIVGNRGNKTAEQVYLQFSYQDGEDSYQPVNLTGHNLEISRQETLQPRTRSIDTDLSNGILRLENMEDGSSLSPGKGRTVSGTIKVPSSYYYAEGLTGSLNLNVEIFSETNDTVTSYNRGLITAEHDEYLTTNNLASTQVEHATYFSTANKISIAMGNTLRLPVEIATTTGKMPVITAVEMNEPGDDTQKLGINYYDAASKSLVMTPTAEGKGYVRISDTATNSIYDIAFVVTETGEGINIFNDNNMFTFYNADGSAFDAEKTGQDWSFEEGVPEWGSDIENIAVPMRNDLSVAEKNDAYFTFQTQAESIELFFDGEIEVSSTFPEFSGINETCVGGKKSVVINFGSNPTYYTHTVTIRAKSENTRFDRYIETFTTGVPPTPSDDLLSPQIYWNRTFPETASLEPNQKVSLTCYVIDESGLATVTMNGQTPDTLKQTDGKFWSFTTEVTQNGELVVAANDISGNYTTRTVRVDWFNSPPTAGAISDAPLLITQMQYENGEPITADFLTANQSAYLYVQAEPTSGEQIDKITCSYFSEEYDGEEITNSGFISQISQGPDGRFPLASNGYYRVTVTDTAGKESSSIFIMNKLDSALPILTISESEKKENGRMLEFSVRKEQSLTAIAEVTLNGQPISFAPGSSIVRGSKELLYGGDYVLYARDEAGNEASMTYTAKDVVIEGAAGITATDSMKQERNDGQIALDPTKITGGVYDPSSQIANDQYFGKYEYLLVPQSDSFTGELGTPEAEAYFGSRSFTNLDAACTIEGLTPQKYVLYLKDHNEENNTSVIAAVSVTIQDNAISQVILEEQDGDIMGEFIRKELRYKVIKDNQNSIFPITSLVLNGLALDIPSDVRTVEGRWPLNFGGEYELVATDANGNTLSASCTAKDVPIDVSREGAFAYTDSWNQARNNGTITLISEKIYGGKYDILRSDPAANIYHGSYEYAIQKKSDTEDEKPLIWAAVEAETVVEGLSPGDYTLYVRDAQEPENEKTIAAYEFSIQDTAVTAEYKVTNAGRAGWDDGSIVVYPAGGTGRGGEYEFAILPLESEDSEMQPLVTLDPKAWSDADLDSDPVKKTFENLKNGYYQVAMREKGLDYSGDPSLYENALSLKIYVGYGMPDQHIVYGEATAGGTISPEKIRVEDAYPAIFTMTPDSGYQLVDILVDGISVGLPVEENADGSYTYRMDNVRRNHTVRAVFAKSAQPGGDTVTVVLPVTEEEGEKHADMSIILAEQVVEQVNAQGADRVQVTTDDHSGDTISFNLPVWFTEKMSEIPGGTVIIQSGEAELTLTGDVLTALSDAASKTVSITLGGQSGEYTVDFVADGKTLKNLPESLLSLKPENLTPGTVPYLVEKDGVETLVHKSITTDKEILMLVNSSAVIRVRDNSKYFSDTAGHWAADAITFASSRELFLGMTESEFVPEGTMTRAMLVTVLYRLEGEPSANTASFEDVPADSWFAKAVAWASENGVVNGVGENKFAPDAQITREQLATMLQRYAEILGIPTEGDGSIATFTDEELVADWARNAVDWAVTCNIIAGKENNCIDPVGNATRAEVATMLQRFVKKLIVG